jgi:hypothetical protein
MSVQTAITAIRNCNTEDELAQIVDALKLQRQFISKQNIRSIAVGDTVEFTARGNVVTGTVIKVNRKNVKVREDGYGIWNVPASLLRRVEQPA